MASQTPLEPETRDLNFSPLLNRDFSIEQTLYELFMNAIDQHCSPDPEEIISISGNTLVIQDQGDGITMENFVLGTRSIMAHSVHGLGMKYAIAFCVQHQIQLTIQVPEGTYSFDTEGEFGSIRVILNRGLSPTQVGSKFILRLPDTENPLIPSWDKVVNEAKKNFLQFVKEKTLIKSKPGYDIYKWENGGSKKGFFLNGIRKKGSNGHPYLFNFKDNTSTLSSWIDENQCVRHDCVRKLENLINPDDELFWTKSRISKSIKAEAKKARKAKKAEIRKAKKAETKKAKSTKVESKVMETKKVESESIIELEFDLPFPSSDELSDDDSDDSDDSDDVLYSDFRMEDTVDALKSAMLVDNAPLYSMSDEQWDWIYGARRFLDRKLKEIPELSIAEIRNQGSVYKNTALPFDADIDIVLVLNNVLTRDELLDIFRNHHDKLELAFFENGSDDIFTGILRYKSRIFPIDITVTDVESEERKDGYKHVEKIRNSIGQQHPEGLEAIRILKYFCKRHDITVKSFYIEEYVKKCLEDPQLSHTKSGLVRSGLACIHNDPNLKLGRRDKRKLSTAYYFFST